MQFRFGIKYHKKIFILQNIKKISKKDPDPVGSGLYGVSRIRIRILKTGSADPDPDPKKMDRIRNTDFNSMAPPLYHDTTFNYKYICLQ